MVICFHCNLETFPFSSQSVFIRHFHIIKLQFYYSTSLEPNLFHLSCNMETLRLLFNYEECSSLPSLLLARRRRSSRQNNKIICYVTSTYESFSSVHFPDISNLLCFCLDSSDIASSYCFSRRMGSFLLTFCYRDHVSFLLFFTAKKQYWNHK